MTDFIDLLLRLLEQRSSDTYNARHRAVRKHPRTGGSDKLSCIVKEEDLIDRDRPAGGGPGCGCGRKEGVGAATLEADDLARGRFEKDDLFHGRRASGLADTTRFPGRYIVSVISRVIAGAQTMHSL